MGPAIGLCLASTAFSACWAQDDLLGNPGFEDLAEGRAVAWTCTSPTAAQFLTAGGHTGPGYARITDPDAGTGISLDSARLLSRPGGRYTARAWFRTTDKVQPGIYLNFYDDLGTRVH
ncbi:MAG: hypothetical protein FJX74_17910, partial [Armatimonadetes bacterium]|nr:hypothetical protein [Armatimonadota bacterium]